MIPRKLTPKQERFCQEYLIDLNGTQAAIRAGYSPKTARSIGTGLIAKTAIQDLLAQKRIELAKKTKVTPERVLQELERIAFADPRRVVRYERGRVILTPSAKLTTDDAATISEISQRADGSVRVKLYDKLKALEMIGRHLAMFVERHEHTGSAPGSINITVQYIDKPSPSAVTIDGTALVIESGKPDA